MNANETKTAQIAEYEIGGQCVHMTAAQAEAWNRGDLDRDAMRGAQVFMPSRVGGRSYVRDGEVVVEDGLPSGEFVDLWTAIDSDGEDTPYYEEFLEGRSATFVKNL